MLPDAPTRRRNDLSIKNIDDSYCNDNYQKCNSNNYGSVSKMSGSVPRVLSESSLTFLDDQEALTCQSLLATPYHYSRERRLSVSLLIDSSNSLNSRRRLRRNSSPRLSNRDGDTNYTTLLTFGNAVQSVYKKLGNRTRRALKTLFVSRPRKPKIVCETDIMEQANWICTDYIINRLTSRQVMIRKTGLTTPGWPKSAHVINAGISLEKAYPKVYSNVSRKLCVTMSSPKIVRTTLTLLLTALFEKSITWGKTVSMFALAGLFGEDCVSQGHAAFVKVVIDSVVEFIGTHLMQWLVSQGGWEAFPVPGDSDSKALSKLRLLILACGLSAVIFSGYKCLDVW